jgi:hypothetical protein
MKPGRPRKEPPVRVTLFLPPHMAAQLEEWAAEEGVSRAVIAVQAVARALRERSSDPVTTQGK